VYVRSLGMSYTYDGQDCVFPDNTRYKPSEMLALAQCCKGVRERPSDMRKLHLVKKLFNGEFLRPGANPDSPYTRKQTVAAAIQADTTRIALQHQSALREVQMAGTEQGGHRRVIRTLTFDYTKPVCVKCGKQDFVILTRGPHMGAYCRACAEWQCWLPKRVADVLLRTHSRYSREKPAPGSGRGEEVKQENLFGHPA